MPLLPGFGIFSVNAGGSSCGAARRVVAPYGRHRPRKAGGHRGPPVPRCGTFSRSSRRGGACPSRRVLEFFQSTLGLRHARRRAESSRPTDVIVRGRRAATEARPSPVAGRFPVHPVGEGLAPPAGFWNFFGQCWGFVLRGGAPSRRALRTSSSAEGGRPQRPARPPLRDVFSPSRRVLERPRPACPDPHPLPRLVGTRRGSEIVPAEILHRTRAQWPGKIKTRNRILRAGTSAEGCRGIPRKRGTGGGATMGGDAHRSPPPAILWFLSHRWARNSPSRAKPCETAR